MCYYACWDIHSKLLCYITIVCRSKKPTELASIVMYIRRKIKIV